MCGICGQYNFKKSEPLRAETIHKMTRTIVHRGPDDVGYYLSGPLGLGFRRLSIIDLNGGHQPMSDREQAVWVVFNGEIYNYLELREELERFGHVFCTRSDTEVIVHGYKQWGDDVFNHFNGMFGVAIWDEKKKRLVIARDPMGIKLIYYRIQDGQVIFGSEIRPILAAIEQRPTVNSIALNMFLRYRYTPSPLTIYDGIGKLAPGTRLVFENGEHRIERWYRFAPTPFAPMPSVAEAQEELLALYKRAMKRHLLSDVPVGLLLSGGVDSGLLLSLMNLYGNSWPTFTIGYGESFKDDELRDAAETARIFRARHVPIQIGRETFENALPRIVNALEEPIASSSVVPMYLVSELARQEVKVVLNGQGPDELFGGYTRHVGVQYGKYWRALPEWMKSPMVSVINSFPRNESLKRGVNSLSTQGRMQRYQQVFSIMPEESVDLLFHDGILPPHAGDAILECWNGLGHLMQDTDELGGFQLLELRSSLPDELLMYADKLSMAHSLEVRVPYLDREVVEYVQRLSADFKVRLGLRKWLHKQVCRDFLPKDIIRRKKRGFAVNVVDEWFKNSLGDKINSYFFDNNSLMYKYLRSETVNTLRNEHISGLNDRHKILFSLVLFEEWLRAGSTAVN